jgi:hypothetical protein
MKYCAIFAIDSWHLNGVHFPSVDCSTIYDNQDEVIDWVVLICNSRNVKGLNNNPITRETILEAMQTKYNVRIPITYPREGEIIIVRK